jgi:hypothetical protein
MDFSCSFPCSDEQFTRLVGRLTGTPGCIVDMTGSSAFTLRCDRGITVGFEFASALTGCSIHASCAVVLREVVDLLFGPAPIGVALDFIS